MAIDKNVTVDQTFDSKGNATYTVYPTEGDPVKYKVFVKMSSEAILYNYELLIPGNIKGTITQPENGGHGKVEFNLTEAELIGFDISRLTPQNVMVSEGASFKDNVQSLGNDTFELNGQQIAVSILQVSDSYDYNTGISHTVVSEDGMHENTYDVIIKVPYKATLLDAEPQGSGTAAVISSNDKLNELTNKVFTEKGKNGVVTYAGDTVTITLTAAADYVCSGITVIRDDNTRAADENIKVEDIGGGKYTFTMPRYNVKITPKFEKTTRNANILIIDKDGNPVDTEEAGTATVKQQGKDNQSTSITGVPWGERVDIFLDTKDGYEPIQIRAKDNKYDPVDKPSGTTVEIIREERLKHYYFMMPRTLSNGGDTVNIKVTVEKNPYTAEVIYNSLGGSATISAGNETGMSVTAYKGDTVTVTATPNEGWRVASIKAENTSESPYTDITHNLGIEERDGKYTFTMPANDVRVAITFSLDTRVPDKYRVKIFNAIGGSATAAPSEATGNTGVDANTPIAVALQPDEGYEIDYDNTEIKPTNTVSGFNVEIISGVYTFNMPASDVEVYPAFKKIPHTVTVHVKPENTGNTVSVYIDVSTETAGKGEDTFKFNAMAGDSVATATQHAEGFIFDRDRTHREFDIEHEDLGFSEGILPYKNFKFTMPDEDVELTVYFKKQYSITCQNTEGGSVTSDKAKAYNGEQFTVTVAPDEGYEYVDGSLTVTRIDNESTVDPNGNSGGEFTYTMPASDVTVKALFRKIGEPVVPVPETYNLTVICEPENGGSVTVRSGTTEKTGSSNMVFNGLKGGEEFTIIPDAAEGYKLVGITSNEVTVDENGKLIMPSKNVTVTVKFAKLDKPVPSEPTPSEPAPSYPNPPTGSGSYVLFLIAAACMGYVIFGGKRE